MLWNHPGTQRYFVRQTDVIVYLRHRNANNYRTEVIHMPKHVIESIRPGFYGYRIDIQFRKYVPVPMPKDFADWILKTFKYVYIDEVYNPSISKESEGQQRTKEDTNKESHNIDDYAPHSDAPLTTISWNDLTILGREHKVFKVGMTKDMLIKALQDIGALDDISTSSNGNTATQ